MQDQTDYTVAGFDKFLSRGDTPNLGNSLDQETNSSNTISFDRGQVSGQVGDPFRTSDTNQSGKLAGDIEITGTLILGNITFDGVNGRIIMRDLDTNRIIIGALPDTSYGEVISKAGVDVLTVFS